MNDVTQNSKKQTGSENKSRWNLFALVRARPRAEPWSSLSPIARFESKVQPEKGVWKYLFTLRFPVCNFGPHVEREDREA